MARFSRMETVTRMKELGLVPIFNTRDAAVAKSILKASYDAGATLIEFTNRGDRAIDMFRELAVYCVDQLPDMIFGAGSIIDAPTAAAYIAAGADFIVSPVLGADVAQICNARKIPYCPGCCTVTEIHNAHGLGVEMCKLFPGDCLGGPDFVKAVKGPMPWTDIIAMGGIAPTEESIAPWFDAGAVCIGMSSKLFAKEWIENSNYEAVTAQISRVLKIIQKVRAC